MVAGIKALVARLRGPDAWDHARAAAALAQQATIRPSLRAPTAEAGALPLLVALLRSTDAAAQESAAVALGKLAMDVGAGIRPRIVDVGAVPALVALLCSGTEDVKACAAFALGWLSPEAPTRALIVAAGALAPLVAMLRSGTDVGKRWAVGTLAWLTRDTPNLTLIADAGALPVLVTFLSPSQACPTGRSTCCTLRRLAMNERLRELALEHGTAGVLAVAADAPGCEWADSARAALRALCPTQGDAERALGALQLKVGALSAERDASSHLENSAVRAERDALAKAFESLASLVGPVAAGHDVVFECENSERIGGSRLLLTHASPYYEALLGPGTVEGVSGVVKPDMDFSSAAHRALIGQLHALGNAPLPAELDVRLELLCLAAKVMIVPAAAAAWVAVRMRCRACSSGGGGRGGAAVRDSLCADNCLAVLLQLKPCAAEPAGLVDAADAVVVEHVREVVEQPAWLEFSEQYPKAALGIMQAIALKLAPKSDESAARKRPRAE